MSSATFEQAIIRELFDPETHQAIISFLDQQVPLMSLNIDETNFVRQYIHNPPFLVKIHKQLQEFATEIFGEPVKPSYVFLSMYKEDGICPLHIDRPQCRYTIDYLIRQTQPEPWPICIAGHMSDDQRQAHEKANECYPEDEQAIKSRIESEKWNTVELNPNDAVCYSGTHSWHYRPKRLKGTADLAFFHFVPENFDGPLA